jgi:glutamyl-tRNA synthetase
VPEVESFLQEFLENTKGQTSSREDYNDLISNMLKSREWGFGKVMPILRVALTGQAKGPDLMQIMSILGAEEISSRVHRATAEFNKIMDHHG